MDPTLVLPLAFLFNGATLALAFDGIVQAIYVLSTSKRTLTVAILLVNNILFFTYCCVNLAQITASLPNCTSLTYTANFFGHATMITLDALLLLKCWIVCRKNRDIGVLLLLALLHRLGWSICDMVMTYAIPVNGVCVYNQYPASLAGFSSADIICDGLATICAIMMNFHEFGSSVARFAAFVFKENS
ncbi:hypothetical protein BC830DRAFT_1173565 [Chytriomyces sp. MP71]|nr:hypothetical protein BC830DRAFT_1173565 [Chytriomyces sp. MP71]